MTTEPKPEERPTPVEAEAAPASPAADTSAAPRLGALLRRRREELGLSYEAAAESTRIRTPLLQALEEEDWERLPLPVFVRGFLRSYGQWLGLDPNELLALYQQTTPASAAPLKPVERRPRIRHRALWLAIAGCVLLILVYILWKGFQIQADAPDHSNSTLENAPGMPALEGTQPPPQLPPGPLETAPADPAAESGADATGGRNRTVAGEVPNPGPSVPTDGESGAAPQDPPPSRSDTPPGHDAMRPEFADNAPRTVPLQLTAAFTERTWLRIQLDDGRPSSRAFPPGAQAVWKAEQEMNLLIGNAGGVQLRVNGRALPALGPSGQVVRLKLP